MAGRHLGGFAGYSISSSREVGNGIGPNKCPPISIYTISTIPHLGPRPQNIRCTLRRRGHRREELTKLRRIKAWGFPNITASWSPESQSWGKLYAHHNNHYSKLQGRKKERTRERRKPRPTTNRPTASRQSRGSDRPDLRVFSESVEVASNNDAYGLKEG